MKQATTTTTTTTKKDAMVILKSGGYHLYYRSVNPNGKEVLNVITCSKTTNEKINNTNRRIIQTYHFSKKQWDVVLQDGGINKMIAEDSDVCFDCPYSKNQGYKNGKCYTHKFRQLMSFYFMIQSVAKKYDNKWEDIPELPQTPPQKFLDKTKGLFVRFGTYGEPTLLPLNWIEAIAENSRSDKRSHWTGYTHQWMHNKDYSKYFMASVDSEIERRIANDMGFLCYTIEGKKSEVVGGVLCPASNKDTSCNVCRGCSGTEGRAKKDFKIVYH
jgi:predicted DNA-binding protein (MmcQ/YjbR family)